MEFRILGPLEVLEDGSPLPLGRLKERTVLAVLLLHANEFVSRERLIDELWGVAPPATARKAVNVYISKLRKVLARNGEDPIATADGGYRLVVGPALLDADRMRRLLAEGRGAMDRGESEAASGLLQEALAFWRGPTLAGLAFESFGRDEVAELDELRLTALMDRIDCDLAQGRHERVLGELQVLVREHPLRERLRAQQMLALYRADRQADALDAYQQARHALIDELGIEPSESLQRLQQAILRHDPALEMPAGTTGANGAASAPPPVTDAVPETVPTRSRRRRPALRRRYLVAAGLVVAAAVAAPTAFLSTRSSGAPPPSSPVSSVSPNTVAFLDPAKGAALVGDPGAGWSKPGPMAVDGNILWILARGSGSIVHYDVRDQPGTPPFPVGPSLYDIAAAGGQAWVSERKPVLTWIRHVGGVTHPVVSSRKIRVHQLKTAGAEAVGGGYLWVIPAPPGTNRVALINVRHPRIQHPISLDSGQQTTAIAYGYRSAWITTWNPGQVASLWKVRPGSTEHEHIELETGDGEGPLAVAVGEGNVWVVTSRGNLLGIDPKTLEIVHRIPMAAEQPEWVAVGAGSVWTANDNQSYSVSQIDPHTNKIVRTTPPLGRWDAVPCGIAATHTAVFVAFGETNCG
jgi:DNA-binding SARP family transcriptional activator